MRQTSSFNNKVLFVDDEPNVLAALKRVFFKMFNISTAVSGEDALGILKNRGPFAVVVSDMNMPKMDGIEFFKQVKKLYPETVRVMLTGRADMDIAIDAVNKGNVFRFVTKPCSNKTMEWILEAAFEQYYLIMAEKELLECTLKGSVHVLIDILSLTNPLAFSQSTRVKQLVSQMADVLKIQDKLKLELAAMLFQIGCVTIPSRVLEKFYRNEKLLASETEMLRNFSEISCSLISEIPRMEDVAAIMAFAGKDCDDKRNVDADETIFLEGEILRTAIAFDILLYRGLSREEALTTLEEKKGCYSSKVLSSLSEVDVFSKKQNIRVKVEDLEIGMVVEEDIRSFDGKILILSKGHEINSVTRTLLENYLNQEKIVGSVSVSTRLYSV